MSNIIRLMREMMRAEEEEAEQMLTMATAVQQYRQLHGESSASQHGGSTLNHRVINRNREEGHARLYRDYCLVNFDTSRMLDGSCLVHQFHFDFFHLFDCKILETSSHKVVSMTNGYIGSLRFVRL